MKLIIEISDNIERIGGKPTDYRTSAYLMDDTSAAIRLSGKNKPCQIKTAQRLDDLAKQIQDVVREYYSSIDTPSVSAN